VSKPNNNPTEGKNSEAVLEEREHAKAKQADRIFKEKLAELKESFDEAHNTANGLVNSLKKQAREREKRGISGNIFLLVGLLFFGLSTFGLGILVGRRLQVIKQ
jgi:phage-related protein